MYIFLTGALMCLFSFGNVVHCYPEKDYAVELVKEVAGYDITEFGNYEDSVLDTITINKDFSYSGQIVPKELINWIENINGKLYSGLLRLIDYYYIDSENITKAFYSGELTEQ